MRRAVLYPAMLRTIVLILASSSSAASGCGSCWCVPDVSNASCPTMPANASAATIATFKALNNTGTAYALDCSPYKGICETMPPLANGTNESVCAFTYGADCRSSYSASTYASAAAAAAAGAVVTHMGACGVCSNAQDLAVYLSLFDMAAPGKKCGEKGLVSTSWGVSCWRDLGMTEACAKIWVYDAIHDVSECGLTCAKHLNTPYNLPPDCRLNSCLQCDEDRAGPNFKTFAGRTRRRSGLASAIQRPCSSVAQGISHLPWWGRANVYGGGQACDAPLLDRLRGGKGQVWKVAFACPVRSCGLRSCLGSKSKIRKRPFSVISYI